jgi:hypothetical protein
VAAPNNHTQTWRKQSCGGGGTVDLGIYLCAGTYCALVGPIHSRAAIANLVECMVVLSRTYCVVLLACVRDAVLPLYVAGCDQRV